MKEVLPRDVPERIAGYRLDGVLGKGGTSTVFSACQVSLDRRVAVKLFQIGHGEGGNAVARMSREARLLARLDHKHVVRCFDFGQEGDFFFLALELVDGESLKERLDRGPMLEIDAVRVTIAVAEALQHAHRQRVIHRDVKPGNVLLARDGRVKLTDFGLARGEHDVELTVAGTTVGTPQYLSPEQARNPRQATEASDVYSLGATLYHMVTGSPPHTGESLAEVISHIVFRTPEPPESRNPSLSPAVAGLIARMMARDSRDRYRGANELLADLRELERALSLDDRRPLRRRGAPAWDELQRRPMRDPLAKAWVLSAAAFLVVVAGAFVWWRRAAPSEQPVPSPQAAAAYSVDRLLSGDLSPRAAWSLLPPAGEEDAASSQFRRRILEEAERRVRQVAASSLRAARQELARGRFDHAEATYDGEWNSGVGRELGGSAGDLPPALSALASRADRDARRDLDEETARVRAVSDDLVRGELTRRSDDLGDALDAAAPDFARAARLVEETRGSLGELRQRFADAVRRVVGVGDESSVSDAWSSAVRERLDETAAEMSRRLAERVEREREAAFAAARAYVPSAAGVDVAAELAAHVTRELGYDSALLPGEPGSVAAAIEARAGELADRARAAAARETREVESAARRRIEQAFEDADFARARAVVTGLPPVDDLQDPWLAGLAQTALDLAEIERILAERLQRSVGESFLVRGPEGVESRLALARFDPDTGRLEFADSGYVCRVVDLGPAAWKRLAGTAMTPRVEATLRYFASDLRGALSALETAEDDRMVVELRARVEDMLDARTTEERALLADASRLLGDFDEAVSRGDLEKAVEAAASLRGDRFAALKDVRRRRREFTEVEERLAQRRTADRRRQEFVDATSGRVRFLEDDRVEIEHDFDSQGELADFRLPGAEWRIKEGMLTSLSPEHRDVEPRWFRNRPGVIRAVPLDPRKPLRVTFDLEMPYDAADPTRFAARLGPLCFGVYSFQAGAGVPGQVNAWRGSIDDFAGYFYRPDLGESRPSRRDASEPSIFRLDRGHRYLVTLDWQSGKDSSCTLSFDGDVVFRLRDAQLDGALEWELRSETPIALRSVSMLGSMPAGPAGGGR